mmetsp:Transcript_1270/g.3227  ORF Transcript_1270/g.3227 Transcript_1270/m.3227 type:complete len:327 (+) Transcript_1270:150-1130(+)
MIGGIGGGTCVSRRLASVVVVATAVCGTYDVGPPTRPFHLEQRLREMQARAEALKEVINSTDMGRKNRRNNEYLSRKLIDDGKDYEISVCRPRGVAFVHVYKAAGTTAKQMVRAGCPEPRHHFSCCGCESEEPGVFCHELQEGYTWNRNVSTTFAVVRDPVDRFRSGIFELALRGNQWMMDNIARAETDNKSVAEVAIDDLRSRQLWFLPDPHLMEQTFFLSEHHKVPHALTYVAKVGPNYVDDLYALGQELLGIDKAVVEHIGHYRDAHNVSYGRDKIYIHDQPLDDKTVDKIKEYYAVDYAWIDHPSIPKPSRRPRRPRRAARP